VHFQNKGFLHWRLYCSETTLCIVQIHADNYICREDYWGSSMWISTKQVNDWTIYSAFIKYLRKKWEYTEAVHQLFIDFRKAYDSVWKEVLYNILFEFGIPMKLVRLIKMCLTETYSRVRLDKNLSDLFPVRFETRRCSVTIGFQLCLRVRHYEGSGKAG